MRITLIIVVLLGLAFWFYQSKTSAKKPKKISATKKLSTKNNPTKLDGKYRSAEIVSGLICCQAVGTLKGQVFLLNDAPQIPLGACDMPDECKCKYVRFNDRRRDERRGDKMSEIAINSGKTDKRDRRGRRATD